MTHLLKSRFEACIVIKIPVKFQPNQSIIRSYFYLLRQIHEKKKILRDSGSLKDIIEKAFLGFSGSWGKRKGQ